MKLITAKQVKTVVLLRLILAAKSKLLQDLKQSKLYIYSYTSYYNVCKLTVTTNAKQALRHKKIPKSFRKDVFQSHLIKKAELNMLNVKAP